MSFTPQCSMKIRELRCMPGTSWIKEQLTLVRRQGEQEDGRENQVGMKELSLRKIIAQGVGFFLQIVTTNTLNFLRNRDWKYPPPPHLPRPSSVYYRR